MSILRKIQRVPHYVDNYVYSTLSSLLEISYGMPGSKKRLILERPAYQMVQLQVLLRRRLEGVLYRVRGRLKGDGRPMTAAFVGKWEIGQRNSLPFYQHLLFEDGSVEVECVEEHEARQFQKVAQEVADQVDLVAFLATNLLLWKPNRGDWAIGPAGIRMAFNIHPNEPWEAHERRMKGQFNNIKGLKKSDYTYAISEAEDDFRDFYHHMHIPMVKARYQDFGDVLNEEGLLHVFKQNGIILQIIDRAGTVVSGGFQFVNRGVLYGLLNGVRDGNQALVKQGALSAIYYYGMKWAYEHGLARFDAGVCPAFVTNGLYMHKKRWGLQPELNYWKPNSILYWAPQSAPDAVAWMKANPFLPQFAKWGGPNMKPVYAELKSAVNGSGQRGNS